MGRYAAYSERTITVENELAITLGDGALCRWLGRRRVTKGGMGSAGEAAFDWGDVRVHELHQVRVFGRVLVEVLEH